MSSKHQMTNFIPGAKFNFILVKKNFFEPTLEMLTALNASKQGLFENLKKYIEDPSFKINKKQNAAFERHMLKTICETYGLDSDLNCYSSDSPIGLIFDWLISEISTDLGESMKAYIKRPYLIYSAHPPVKFTVQDMQNFSKNMKKIFLRYLDKKKFKEVVKITKENPCLEDFTEKESHRKTDAYRKINHSRSEIIILSFDELKAEYDEDDEEPDFEYEHIWPDDEATGWTFTKSFLSNLDSVDRRIVEMRMFSLSYEKIADELGFKTHSAVIKRLLKLEDRLREFAGKDFHLDSYLKPEFRKKDS